MSVGLQGPPGLGEVDGGVPSGGCGRVGEARACYDAMARVMKRLAEIRDNVEFDSINVEKYVKELTNTIIAMTRATGRMFEQEHFRMINVVTAINQ